MKEQNFKIKLKNMSRNSGVYKMLDKTGNVIYVKKLKRIIYMKSINSTIVSYYCI